MAVPRVTLGSNRYAQEGKMIPDATLKFQRFCLITLMLVAVSLVVFTYSDVIAYYGAKYTESAHGNSTDGVNRSGLSGYSAGNCAHCHEQHASIDGSSHTAYDFGLFAPNNPTSQTDNFCFQCHDSASSVQAVTNYSYSRTFGGGSSTTPDDIQDAFDASGSSHNLSDVVNHAVGRGIGFTSDTNPCFVCHDQHASQQNYPVTLSGLGGVKTAIRMPYKYASDPTELFGDEIGGGGSGSEIMSDYTAKYQAPYYKNGGGKYEPANNDISNGDNLPNFRRFCINNCHGNSDVTSTDHGGNLLKIDWGTSGNIHGKTKSDQPDNSKGDIIAPYTLGKTYNYVLACTDCHEPHGSPNEWLLRTCVNGKDNITIRWGADWWEFCTACHVFTDPVDSYHEKSEDCCPVGCIGCHKHQTTTLF